MKAILAPVWLFSFIFMLPEPASAQAKPKSKTTIAIPYDSLRNVLENILEKDQGVRKKLSTTPPAERMNLFREMRQIDSANQVKVKAMLARYGWLPESKLGEQASDAQFFVIQHADAALMEKYLPQLQQLARNGEAKRTHAAMMEDRILMNQRKKQVYGTQGFSNQLTQGKMIIWPIEDHAKVNQRRLEAGFGTTEEEYAKQLGAAYNPTEVIPGLLAE
jgi:hypothetical protein